jgi:NodT family efflux transporter outer membrane factor (OMF) lipoprotein
MFKMRPLLFPFIVTMLTACTVGPHFHRPAAPAAGYEIGPSVGEQRIDRGTDARADWYELFHSEALVSLVHRALAANPTLDSARHNLLASQFQLRAVAAAALPQVELDGHAERAKVNGSFLYEPVEMLQVTANQFNLGPALAYNLDPFGELRRAIEAQRAVTEAIRDESLNAYITLVSEVVMSAFDLAASQEQIDVTRRLIADLEEQYRLTAQLEQLGKSPRSDTLQAQTQLENARATLPGLEKQHDVYRNTLLTLVGEAPDARVLPPLSLRDFTLPAALPVSLPSQLVRQRPDVLAAEETLHAACAAVGVAEAARLPGLAISAQYAQQATTTGDLFTKAGGIWSAGVNLTAPIFEGGRLQATEMAAREQFKNAADRYRSTVLGAFADVANALQGLQHDADSYAAHVTALGAAGANRDLAREEFRQGKVSELVVLTAEQQFQSAALTQVQADAQRFMDVATLFHALGGGWWSERDPLDLATTH